MVVVLVVLVLVLVLVLVVVVNSFGGLFSVGRYLSCERSNRMF